MNANKQVLNRNRLLPFAYDLVRSKNLTLNKDDRGNVKYLSLYHSI